MTREFKVALMRALGNSSIIGGLVFLSTWSQTDDIKTLVIATGTAILTSIGTRFGIEGYIDSTRSSQRSDPKAVA